MIIKIKNIENPNDLILLKNYLNDGGFRFKIIVCPKECRVDFLNKKGDEVLRRGYNGK